MKKRRHRNHDSILQVCRLRPFGNSLLLTAVGAAGVPSGSIPLLIIVLQTVEVPAEGIALILGVDRILDMCRMVLNVTGDITYAAYIARTEGVALKG